MAEYYAADAAETHKLYSKKLWTEFRKRDSIYDGDVGLMGSDEASNGIVVVDDMQKSIGDQVTIPISFQLDGRGQIGDEVAEGKSMHIKTDTDAIKIDEQFNSVYTRGRMNAQRVAFDGLEEGKNKLADWWHRRRAVSIINHLSGNSRQTDLAYTGLMTVNEPDTEHIYRVGSGLGTSDDQTVGADSSATLDMDTVDELVTIAEQLTPAIRPIQIEGNPYYVLLVHPDVITDIRKSDTQWYAAMLQTLAGGAIDGNPLFRRAAGMWRNVIIISEPRIPRGTNSNGTDVVANSRRCVFMGAGSVCVAYGRQQKGEKEHFYWANESYDFGRKLAAGAGMIWGVKSPRFTVNGTARDYGKIVVTVRSTERLASVGDLDQEY